MKQLIKLKVALLGGLPNKAVSCTVWSTEGINSDNVHMTLDGNLYEVNWFYIIIY